MGLSDCHPSITFSGRLSQGNKGGSDRVGWDSSCDKTKCMPTLTDTIRSKCGS